MDKNILNLIDLATAESGESEAGMVSVSGKDVAVIGIGIKFPQANDVGKLWNILSRGRDCAGQVSWTRERDMESYCAALENQKPSPEFPKAAYLKGIDQFDYGFFNLSPKEASLMDPSQRLFLETVWQALEDAGYGGAKIRGSRTGVFVGYSNEAEYKKLVTDLVPDLLSMAIPGNLAAVIPGRVSYLLDLKGPSLLVNTACSSSLVATHLACQALKNRECHLAIAAGIRINIFPVTEGKLGIESAVGQTRTFDHHSDGMSGGEGIGVVLLKPLPQAIKDRDNIYAVIKGGAYNQDGASLGLSAPNPAAQEDVITRAWKEAGVDPATITYIEAHGTGTELGDTIEIDGIQRSFRRFTDQRQFCAVGSIKSNFGHLDAAAGIAGLIKAVLALKYGQLPPTLHFERPNRKIPFYKSPVYVNTALMDWETDHPIRRCGVSSFGFSGTNCHLVLEEAPPPRLNHGLDKYELLLLSAASKFGLKKLIQKFLDLDYQNLGLGNVCYTVNTGRGHYNYRLAIIFSQTGELLGQLKILAAKGLESFGDLQIFYGVNQEASPAKISAAVEELTPEAKRKMSLQAEDELNKFVASSRQDLSSLSELCRLYVKGADPNWEVLYKGQDRRRVSAPTYPFEPNRCWIEPPYEKGFASRNLYYKQVWKPFTLIKADSGITHPRTMIFSDELGVAGKIAAQLRGQGEEVIEVGRGEKYGCIHEDSFRVGPSQEDYDQLIAETKPREITRIIHMFSIWEKDKQSSAGGLDSGLERGLYSLFFLFKGLHKYSGGKDMELVVVTSFAGKVDGSEKDIFPENGALLGLAKAIQAEKFNLKCRRLDFDDTLAARSVMEEMEAAYQPLDIAYRNGIRYAPEMVNVSLTDAGERPLEIKEDGVYVLAGGMGGIGLEIARYLATRGKVNLALIHRAPLPPREEWENLLAADEDGVAVEKIKAIMEIESYGANVECCRADIVQERELDQVFSMLRTKYGKIHGIIQSAGVGVGKKGRLLKDDNIGDFEAVLSAKIKGTWNLDKLSVNDELDFLILFSSPITITGGIGSGAYIAANGFLDSFTAYGNRRGKRTITLSWAPWEQTIRRLNEEFDSGRQMFRPLSSAELVYAFGEALEREESYLIVGKLNFDSAIFKMEGLLPFTLAEELRFQINGNRKMQENSVSDMAAAKLSRVRLKGSKDGNYTETQQQVADVIGNILGYGELDLFDNFYELGGDSIIALKVMNTIRRRMAIPMVITDLLKRPVLRNFAEHLELHYLKKDQRPENYAKIPQASPQEFYEVSSSQRRLFLISQYEKEVSGWNISYMMLVEGNLDRKRFEEAFRQIIKRHEAMRTSFHLMDGKVMQRIHEEVRFQVDYFDWDGNLNQMEKEFNKPFDLSKPPLFKVRLGKAAGDQHYLLFEIHHIIADEISMEIMMKELVSLYEGQTLEAPALQYKDFSEWQNKLYHEGSLSKQENYWRSVFAEAAPVLELPLDYPRPAVHGFQGEKLDFTLGAKLVGSVKNLARRTNTTEYWLLMAVFSILLAKFSGREELVVGAPVYGRPHSSLDNTMGMFVNVLPLRNRPAPTKNFMEFLDEVRNNMVKAYENQDYPFDRLVEKVLRDSQVTGTPLVNVSFQMHKILFQEMALGSELKFIPREHRNVTSKQDLLLEFFEADQQLVFALIYDTRLFQRETMDRFIKGFINILEQVILRPDMVIADLSMTPAGEARNVVAEFNEKLDEDF